MGSAISTYEKRLNASVNPSVRGTGLQSGEMLGDMQKAVKDLLSKKQQKIPSFKMPSMPAGQMSMPSARRSAATAPQGGITIQVGPVDEKSKQTGFLTRTWEGIKSSIKSAWQKITGAEPKKP